MTNPKISIIVTCFNYGGYLPEAIDSVLGQTFQDFEIIIVDDCSDDNTTPAIVKEQAKRDKRIKVIFHEENKWVAAARNTGISVANGKYILSLDADDKIMPTYLEKILDLIEKKDADLAYCHTQFFEGKNSIFYHPHPKKVKRTLPFTNFMPQTCVHTKSCWEEFGGYNENLFGYEAWDFWIYFVEYDKKIVLLNESLLLYRIHGDSKVHKSKKIDNELKKTIKQNHPNLYQWRNYYFTYRYFKFIVIPAIRNFRRFFIQIKLRKNYKKIRFLGITFYEEENHGKP